MGERIPTTPSRLAVCMMRSCGWAGSISDAIEIRGIGYCPVCSCACEIESACDEPIILHASGSAFDPLAITK